MEANTNKKKNPYFFQSEIQSCKSYICGEYKIYSLNKKYFSTFIYIRRYILSVEKSTEYQINCFIPNLSEVNDVFK